MNYEENAKIQDFFEDLFHYVCISGNMERVKNEIGIKKAFYYKIFLRDYLEDTQENVYEFAQKFIKSIEKSEM